MMNIDHFGSKEVEDMTYRRHESIRYNTLKQKQILWNEQRCTKPMTLITSKLSHWLLLLLLFLKAYPAISQANTQTLSKREHNGL